jgi:hypothetical protein
MKTIALIALIGGLKAADEWAAEKEYPLNPEFESYLQLDKSVRTPRRPPPPTPPAPSTPKASSNAPASNVPACTAIASTNEIMGDPSDTWRV